MEHHENKKFIPIVHKKWFAQVVHQIGRSFIPIKKSVAAKFVSRR